MSQRCVGKCSKPLIVFCVSGKNCNTKRWVAWVMVECITVFVCLFVAMFAVVGTVANRLAGSGSGLAEKGAIEFRPPG